MPATPSSRNSRCKPDLSSFVDGEGNSSVASVQLGVKSADGSTVSYAIIDCNDVYSVNDLKQASTRTMFTATDVRASSYMYPPVRINGGQYGCGSRLSAGEAARCDMEWDRLRFTQEEFVQRVGNMEKMVADGCPAETEQGVQCRAGSTSFWMTWDGRMLPCGMMTQPVVSPLEEGFDAAWNRLREETARIRTPRECGTCGHRELCQAVLAEYDVSPEETARDIRKFLEKLKTMEII